MSDNASLVNAQLQYDNEKKSPIVPWILWFFLGYLGIHRFYLGQKEEGAYILLGWFTFYIVAPVLLTGIGLPSVAFLGLVAVVVWWIVEAVLLSNNIKKVNNQKRVEIFRRNGLEATSY